IEVKLHDPGQGAALDGLIRLEELGPITSALVTSQVIGEGDPSDGQQDVELTGNFSVSVFNFPLLSDLGLSLKWPNVNDLSTVTIAPALGGTGQKILDFLNVNANQIVSGIDTLASGFQQLTGVDVLATKIPLLNKSLGEILNGPAKDIVLPNASISAISAVATDD